MKNLSILICLLLLFAQESKSCSMFTYTHEGKTMVGNNEDYFDPDTWMWTVKERKGKYGSVFFGFGNFFAQGGMNEAGLVFDGFAMESKPIVNTDGKKSISASKLIQDIMATCATVDEVAKVMEQYNLSFLVQSQLMFVDKSGASLIVEGDDFIRSDKPYQITTNFYQSSTPKSDFHKVCNRYAKGDALLSQGFTHSTDYGKSVLDAMHSEEFWGGTQYSNLYDLSTGKIYLFLFHNYEEVVELSLEELLEKKEQKIELRSLFQQKESYETFRVEYYHSKEISENLSKHTSLESLEKDLKQLSAYPISAIWSQQFSEASDDFQKKDKHDMAISLISFCKELYPNSWRLSAMLAKSYFLNKQTEKAKIEIARALQLNPGDEELLAAQKKILEALDE